MLLLSISGFEGHWYTLYCPLWFFKMSSKNELPLQMWRPVKVIFHTFTDSGPQIKDFVIYRTKAAYSGFCLPSSFPGRMYIPHTQRICIIKALNLGKKKNHLMRGLHANLSILCPRGKDYLHYTRQETCLLSLVHYFCFPRLFAIQKVSQDM